MSRYAATIPMRGERTMKARVTPHLPATKPPKPALANAAPAYPPIKAWEELVGNARYQVKTSHRIAPIRPASKTQGVTRWILTNPLPIVAATPVPSRYAARKLKTAAQTTATLGVSTRVERSEEH